MLLYSLIMFPVSALLIAFAVAIYKGHTHLIHDYHQTKVTDREAYGKAFGKALFLVGLAPLISGTITLFGDTPPVIYTSLTALALFFVLGFVSIYLVQKKYNGGMF